MGRLDECRLPGYLSRRCSLSAEERGGSGRAVLARVVASDSVDGRRNPHHDHLNITEGGDFQLATSGDHELAVDMVPPCDRLVTPAELSKCNSRRGAAWRRSVAPVGYLTAMVDMIAADPGASAAATLGRVRPLQHDLTRPYRRDVSKFYLKIQG